MDGGASDDLEMMMAGSGDGISSDRPKKQDPLTVDLILKTLFEHLPLEDLAKCRLVSKQWYHESLWIWRNTSTLWFRSSSGEFFDDKGVRTTHTVNFIEFLDFWEKIRDWKPYRKFRLEFWNGYRGPQLNSEDVTRFWVQIGSHVTTLTLKCYTFDDAREVRQVMYQACPNLQNLTMDDCRVMDLNYSMQRTYRYEPMRMRMARHEDDDGSETESDDGDGGDGEDNDAIGGEDVDGDVGDDIGGGQDTDTEDDDDGVKEPEPIFGEHTHLRSLTISECLPDSWLELLSHFPLLNSLTFTSESACTRIHRKLLEAIQHVRKQSSMNLPLDQFNVIPFALEDDFYEGLESYDNFVLLRKLQLPLKHFHLILYDDIDPSHIKTILQDHAQTIRKIDVSQYDTIPLEQFPFGVELPNLKTLSISNPFEGNCFGNMHFLKYMPNMRRMDIYDRSRDHGNTPFCNTSEIEMTGVILPKLSKLTLDFPLTEESMRGLIRWMPNMKKLRLPLDDHILSIVCGGWQDLIELIVWGERLTDEGVTGIVAGEEETRPNVTHLTKLTDLDMWGRNLTEASVFEGFLKMPSLKRLVLRAQSAQIWWGGEGDTALRAKVLVLDQLPRTPQDSDNEDSDSD